MSPACDRDFSIAIIAQSFLLLFAYHPVMTEILLKRMCKPHVAHPFVVRTVCVEGLYVVKDRQCGFG